jgi:hypothetical protein
MKENDYFFSNASLQSNMQRKQGIIGCPSPLIDFVTNKCLANEIVIHKSNSFFDCRDLHNVDSKNGSIKKWKDLSFDSKKVFDIKGDATANSASTGKSTIGKTIIALFY